MCVLLKDWRTQGTRPGLELTLYADQKDQSLSLVFLSARPQYAKGEIALMIRATI